MARLVSVNVGLPKEIGWRGQTVRTGIWKTPVKDPRMVRRLNIDGDGQGDRNAHGGEHRAVLVYQLETYRFWSEFLKRDDFVHGQFGENFTVEGLSDEEVCVGDRYRIGGALFEVTQPRVTCYRLGIRMNEPGMAALLVQHRRPGFYLRVLEEGVVEAGDEITRVMAGPEGMSVSDFDALLYMPGHPAAQLERALRIPTISTGWRRSFEALLAQARGGSASQGNAGLGRTAGAPAWAGFRPLRVARKRLQGRTVVSLELEAVDGAPLPAALPGQYLVLRLDTGSGSPVTRSYSLSGAPDSYRLGIKRETHGIASAYANDMLHIGDIVQASAPRGSFTLAAGDAPVVLMSAGIGVTPVLAMLHALAAQKSTREVWWLHGARSGEEHPFADEARALVRTLAHGHSHICYSRPGPEDRPALDFDTLGHLDMAVLETLPIPPGADFYICGPSPFMDALSAGILARGVAAKHIHTEVFGATPTSNSGIVAVSRRTPHVPEGAAGSGPTVLFTRSGLDVRWDPRFASLLELAEACDVPVRWACRSGACHTCETGLIAGAVRYQPAPLDAPPDGVALICCARPRGDILLDL